MTNDELEKAERIERDFPDWDRPMTIEESELMDRYYEWKIYTYCKPNHWGYNED